MSLQPWSQSGGRSGARTRYPGFPVFPPGVERYRVPGGGSILLRIAEGDRIRVIDREGGQVCELAGFASDGAPAPDTIETIEPQGAPRKVGDGEAFGAALCAADPDGALRRAMARHGVALNGVKPVTVFAPDGPAGAKAEFVASAPGVAIIRSVGGPMRVDEQTPPTELTIFVERAKPQDWAEPALPEPLADPRLDFRIDRATASAYEVKAGESIQIIDVAGQQCSDLQAFPVAQLDRGIERCLDVTTTRTLMAQAYPGPGSMAKYYDRDFQALLEIVQDNCTRHDAFGLACTAKYYDDVGYPGHINCSDNFNKALEPFPVAPRCGWMAMNFFYNTGISDRNQFYLDEPWSRPGDHVLLRALTDLAIVTSACPDDTSAANGWNPTDIHVRIYGRDRDFKRSIGFRKRTDADVEMTKETGFHPRTSALTRNFTEYNGFWLPSGYPNHGAVAEYWACREKATLMDLSALRKFEIVGPDAETLLQRCLTRNIRRLAVGHVVYSAMCHRTGGMIDDGTLLRFGPDNFRWVGGADFGGDWLRQQAGEMGLNARVRSSTDQIHNISVQGPASREILKRIVWTPPSQPSLEELNWFRLTIGRIGDCDGVPIVASRTGYTGELGYEVWCHPDHAPALWDAVWEAGAPHGMTPLGLEGLDILRVESGLVFAGYEFDDRTDPFEAGIGFTVPLKSKNEDFIGREALQRRKDSPQRKLVGLELEGGEPAAHGDCVHVGQPQVGTITSGTRSPILNKNIALCRMSVEYSEPGTWVEIGKLDGHIKRLPAKVVPFPFYDPDKTRPRS